jgi:mannose-1-phosphate guanylyltransferase
VTKNPHFYPIILAGGRGTRFWPLSRKRRAKQLLALDGKQTMIQQTVARLAPMAAPSRFWIITNDDLRPAILRQLRKLPAKQVIAEPAGRNTAPAIGLAAFLLLRQDPDAVLGLFPSDHVIAEPAEYRATLTRGIEIAAAGENIVVLGIRPTRPETGYGYIEAGAPDTPTSGNPGSLRVRRFTEKPDLERARQFVEAGNYFWNSGMFLWRADTLANALREHLPKTAVLLERIAAAYGTRKFADTFRKLYPKCEKHQHRLCRSRTPLGQGRSTVAYLLPALRFRMERPRLLDRAARTSCIKVENQPMGNRVSASGSFAYHAKNNYVHSLGKFVALVGVSNLVIVETEDAPAHHHARPVAGCRQSGEASG